MSDHLSEEKSTLPSLCFLATSPLEKKCWFSLTKPRFGLVKSQEYDQLMSIVAKSWSRIKSDENFGLSPPVDNNINPSTTD
jgi:hypothetical protein